MARLRPLIAATFLALKPLPGLAQGATNGLSLSAAYVPDYEGSSDNLLGPAVTGRLSFGDDALDLLGTGARIGLRADLLGGPIAVGPILNYRFCRSDDVDNIFIARLPEIDGAAELGIFLVCPLTREFAL